MEVVADGGEHGVPGVAGTVSEMIVAQVDGRQRVEIVRVPGQRSDVGDELTAARAVRRG